uniref:Uncharacterized protein n=1 Tax=Corethron hystrix TaxID=216773 RepID=A0A7S1FSE1_9STRA|mmetsp:Transcript_23912/g.54424  ORF Transcript_23912/g.54424 Transcript_23912/m.54424 type:complete len:110 (+) Transcript_23912:26-355(+)
MYINSDSSATRHRKRYEKHIEARTREKAMREKKHDEDVINNLVIRQKMSNDTNTVLTHLSQVNVVPLKRPECDLKIDLTFEGKETSLDFDHSFLQKNPNACIDLNMFWN